MLDEIEVGKIYLDEDGIEWEALRFFEQTLQCIFIRFEDNNEYTTIITNKCMWKKFKLKKEEPKKLGQLGVAIQNQENGYGFDVIVGQLQVLNDNYSKELWLPVTINEKGEVFSVE